MSEFLYWFSMYCIVGLIITVVTAIFVEYQGPKEWPETFLGWVVFLLLGSLAWPITVGFGIIGICLWVRDQWRSFKYRRKSHAKKRF